MSGHKSNWGATQPQTYSNSRQPCSYQGRNSHSLVPHSGPPSTPSTVAPLWLSDLSKKPELAKASGGPPAFSASQSRPKRWQELRAARELSWKTKP